MKTSNGQNFEKNSWSNRKISKVCNTCTLVTGRTRKKSKFVYQTLPRLSDVAVFNVMLIHVLRTKHCDLSAEICYKNEHSCVEKIPFVLQPKKPLEISRELLKNPLVVLVSADKLFFDRYYTLLAFIDKMKSQFYEHIRKGYKYVRRGY
jgi:hypothetical protein